MLIGGARDGRREIKYSASVRVRYEGYRCGTFNVNTLHVPPDPMVSFKRPKNLCVRPID